MMADSVWAQSAPTTAPLEEVVVTGSRVRRSNLSSPTPLTVVSGDQIRFSGYNAIGQVLNYLPKIQPSLNSQNTNSSLFSAGQNAVDIRGLGSNRTLVLVNGRRHHTGSFTNSSVDTNLFPSGFIDRVDIVTGGGSATYGSEAISGVVNIITRKDLDGFEVNSQVGATDKGDSSEWNISGLAGTHFLGGRGYTITAIESTRQEPINATQRDWAYPGIGLNSNFTNNPIIPLGHFTTLNGGGVFGRLGVYLSPDHKRLGTITPDCVQGLLFCQNPDYPYLNIYATLRNKIRRQLFNNYSEYQFTDNLKGHVELEWSAVNALATRAQPSFYTGSAFTVRRDNGFLLGTDPLASQLRAAFDAAGLRLPTQSTTANIFFDDIGQRLQKTKRISQRAAVGFEGDVSLLARKINWDVSYVRGELRGTTYGDNQFYRQKLNDSLDAILDATGAVVCRSATARANGCVPYDFIHGPSQAALNYVKASSIVFGRVTQDVADLNLTTDLFQLPAGPLGLAWGGEYRKETSDQNPDDATQQGLLFTNQIARTTGQFDVKEAYAEAVIPLLKDLPFVKYLSAEVSGRTGNYSSVGSVKQYKLGAEYAPVEDVRFRYTLARAVRAPNITELFQPQQDNFASTTDPCDFREIPNAPDKALRIANCKALLTPGLPNYDPNTFRSNVGAGGVTVHQRTGGSPTLKAERANTFNIGAVVTPRWIPDLVITADYYTVTIRDAVNTLPLASIYNFCYDQRTDPKTNRFCALIKRDFTGTGPYSNGVAGAIDTIFLTNLNVANYHVSGMDYEITYRFDVAPLLGLARIQLPDPGDVLLRVQATNTQTTTFQGDPSNSPLSYENLVGTPRWNGTGSVAWRNDRWGFTWATRYLSAQKVSNTLPITARTPFYTKAYTTHDVRLDLTVNDHLTTRLGVVNLLDHPPPQLPATYLGTGTGSSQYDNRGRFIYLAATLKY